MSKRNRWTDNEVMFMLNIMKKMQIMKRIDCNKVINLGLFKNVQTEMFAAGFKLRNASQMKVKWNNLKNGYFTAKNNNKKYGYTREKCSYYDALNELLRKKTSNHTKQRDSVKPPQVLEDKDNDVIIIEVCPDIVMGGELHEGQGINTPDYCSTPSPPNAGPQIKTTTLKNMINSVSDWKNAQLEIQKYFFERQKELIKYRLEEASKLERAMRKEHEQAVKRIVQSAMDNMAQLVGNIMQGPRQFSPAQFATNPMTQRQLANLQHFKRVPFTGPNQSTSVEENKSK